jgi:hypothetical protein
MEELLSVIKWAYAVSEILGIAIPDLSPSEIETAVANLKR